MSASTHSGRISRSAMPDVVIRRELRDGDAEAIADLHQRLYQAEHGMDERFGASVARSLVGAVERGWPRTGGAVWLVERQGELAGSLVLTDEGSGDGRVRCFLLAPELRGLGLGRSLLANLLAEARAAGMRTLALETFSDLTAAARLYREAGFTITWERETDQWGPPIRYQRYELELR
jgi:ribosomal protein S18 acetylase RimI-like enzyme